MAVGQAGAKIDMRFRDLFYGTIALIFGLVLLAALINLAYKAWLRSRFWLRYGRRGKFILFVYSNSPNWKDYVESNILPRIESHAVTLNWSEQKTWKDEHAFEAKVFRRWAGCSEFNPVAIIFPPAGKVKVIRFWQAFRDYKHGKEQQLRRAEAELFKEVNEHATNAV
jgi:hypothetical protein